MNSPIEESSNEQHQTVAFWLFALLCSEGVSTGQLARLRKTKVAEPTSDVWWALAMLEKFKLKRTLRESETAKWITLVKLLAILARTSAVPASNDKEQSESEVPRKYKISLGQALYECGDSAAKRAGFSELRLAALLDSHGVQFTEKLTRVCRQLASKQQSFNYQELAALLECVERRDCPRQKVARDYYRRTATAAAQITEEVN